MEREEGTREEDTGLSIRRGWFSKASKQASKQGARSKGKKGLIIVLVEKLGQGGRVVDYLASKEQGARSKEQGARRVESRKCRCRVSHVEWRGE